MKELVIEKDKRKSLSLLVVFLQKISSGFEIVFILLVWFFIFSNANILGDFSIEDMVAYLLIGNLIGLLTSYLLHKSIGFNLGEDDSKMFYYKPLAYIFRVFSRSIRKLIIPFFLSILLNMILVYFFVNNLYLNSDIHYLLLIALMMILAFFTELFLALLIDLYVFWVFESRGIIKSLSRLKKIFAGAYFPLGFLGFKFLMISLFFPFAYLFYVPTQLYLKNISFKQGFYGLFVQVFWLVVLYSVIKLSWKKKFRTDEEILKRKNILE